MPDNQLLVVAGDPSGDERAAEVIENLKRIRPEIGLFGIGGEALASQGVELLYSIDEVNVFGLTEALLNYFRLKKVFDHLLQEYEQRKAAGALLVDFGGFNLRLATRLKNLPGKTVYYISPQVWATRAGRAETMASAVDQLCVIFGFEKDFYRKYGLAARHVGHPLMDSLYPRLGDFKPANNHKQRHLVLMPGSRKSELERHAPIIKETVEQLRQNNDFRVTAIAAQGRKEWLHQNMGIEDLAVTGPEEKYSTIADADCVLMASGTATLEVALFNKPAVVIYKTSFITGFIGRRLIQIPWVAMPNILAGKEVYPEFIQERCRPELIAPAVEAFLVDTKSCDRIRHQLEAVHSQLGEPGAARRVAEVIEETVDWRE